MRSIRIKKSGKILLDEISGDVIKTKKINSLKEHLACEVEFGDGLTFGTFFRLILREKDFFDVVFAHELNGKKLSDFEEDFNYVPENLGEDFKLIFLEVSKLFEFFTFDKGNTINLLPVFMGIGHTTDGFDMFVPINLFSVGELKNLEIVHNHLVEVYREVYIENEDDDAEEKNVVENTNNEDEDGRELIPNSEAFTKITLYETIQCILYEIAFYKNDKDRLLVRKNQNNEYMIKNKIQILKAQLKKYIDNDEFEEAAVAKKELDKLTSIIGANKN